MVRANSEQFPRRGIPLCGDDFIVGETLSIQIEADRDQAVWQRGSLPQLRILLERLNANGETNGFRPTLRIPSILMEPTEWDG